MKITIRRLDSGYYHIRGEGPCNWSQPPCLTDWREDIRKHAHPEAGDEFIQAAIEVVRIHLKKKCFHDWHFYKDDTEYYHDYDTYICTQCQKRLYIWIPFQEEKME